MPFDPNVPPSLHEDFQKWFATWSRLEPRSRSNDFTEGLQCRFADPLWTLGRQWQVGEFNAEDAASPIRVSVEYQTKPLTAGRLGPEGSAIELEGAPPLEVIVERMVVPFDWRTRVLIGRQFEQFLRLELEDAIPTIRGFRQRFPVVSPSGDDLTQLDRATQRFLRIASGRSINGEALLNHAQQSTPPVVPAGIAGDQDSIRGALTRLVDWWAKLYSQPEPTHGSAWVGERLEHEFEVAAGPASGRVVVGTSSYRNGELDWYSVSDKTPFDETWDEPSQIQSFLPTQVMFHGQPHSRWFAIEDSDIDFGSVDISTTDLGKMMLMHFSLIYGDDWFVVPFELPVGSVVRVQAVIVRDVFSGTTVVPRALTHGDDPLKRWQLFGISRDGASASESLAEYTYSPAGISYREVSQSREEVRYIRDEMANMVWAVQRYLPNGLGERVGGAELFEELARMAVDATGVEPGPEGAAAVLPQYRLTIMPPSAWIPYVPVRADAGVAAVVLRRARLLNAQPWPPASSPAQVLRAGPYGMGLAVLNEESVSRAGVNIRVVVQRGRWQKGETFLWIGPSIAYGAGEGDSGIEFDAVEQ